MHQDQWKNHHNIYIYNMSNIKYFGFAKASSSVPVYAVCQEKQIEDEVKIQAGKVLNQLRSLNLRVQERQKIKSANGTWCSKKDGKQMVYIVLCSSNYPQRHIYAAMNQLRDHLQKLGDYQTQPDSTLKLHAKSVLIQICAKYQNIKNLDKVGEAQGHITQLRQTVSQNVQKIIQNQAPLGDLQRQSESLKQQANQFKQMSKELKKLMYWRNCKLKIIIGIIIVCIICLVVVPIATKK